MAKTLFTREWLQQYENKARARLQSPEPQRAPEPTLVPGPVPGKTSCHGRVIVRITDLRVRPTDPDNLAGGCKALLDCLRYAGLIPDDNPAQIKLEVESQKVRKRSSEKTIVELIYPDA